MAPKRGTGAASPPSPAPPGSAPRPTAISAPKAGSGHLIPSTSKAPEQQSPADKLAAMTQAAGLSYPTWTPSAARMAWAGSYRQNVSICRGWGKKGPSRAVQEGLMKVLAPPIAARQSW